MLKKSDSPVLGRYGQLVEQAAQRYRDRTFIEYKDQRMSFSDLSHRSNRIARNLDNMGIGIGDGVAIMMTNHPRFLELFFAVQKLGAYVVPVNVKLIRDGLTYILNHSEVRVVMMDSETSPMVEGVRGRLVKSELFYVFMDEAPEGYRRPPGMMDCEELLGGVTGDEKTFGYTPRADDPSTILYTSGTSGPPKGVVNFHGLPPAAGTMTNPTASRDEKLYTCLPLFHANALMLTVMRGLSSGTTVYLSKRFSASNFWKEVAGSGATTFNTIGGIIPILLKTPPSPYDTAHKVKLVHSAACPADAWIPFEKRFGVKIWEGYGAVDGGGVAIGNRGDGPVGSLGKPAPGMTYRLVDGQMKDVADGQPGELIVYMGKSKRPRVVYFKNKKATHDKIKAGWLHTGDLMRQDENGYLYFVGRNTDSMRRRGENVSAYEVEKQVDDYADVLESAAFGVPSDVGEDDIMVCVVAIKGRTIDPNKLFSFLTKRLPIYALPHYIEIINQIPKTGTHRVIKEALKKRGVTKNTVDLTALRTG